VRRRQSATKLWLRSVAALLLLMGMLVTIAQPAAAQQDDDLGLVDDSEYQSPQFAFAMTWDSPWEVTEDSLGSTDGEFDTIQLESGASFVQVILIIPTDEPDAYLDALASSLEENNLDYEEIGADSGRGYSSKTVEFSFESGGDEFRVREYIEVNEIETADGDDALFAGSFWSIVDDFEDEWDLVNETIQRDGGDPLFLGLPEGISGGSASEEEPTDEPQEEPTEEDPTDEPSNNADRTAGIDGNVFVGGVYGFSVEWDDSVWEAEDLSTDSDDALLLTSDTAEILFRSTNVRGGDVRTCVTEYADELKEGEDVSGFGRATGYTLPEGVDGSFARMYDYTEGSGTRAESVLQYIQCRPFDGAGFLLIALKTSEAAYEDELENFLDVLDTVEFGEPPDDSGNSNQPEEDPTEEPEEDPTPETEEARDPVLDDTSYTGGQFDFVIEFDDAVWTAEELTPDDGFEGVSLSSESSSAFIEAFQAFDGDPDECLQVTVDGLETTDGISNVDEETRLDLPTSARGVSASLNSYTYTGSDGGTLDFIQYTECREIIEGESVLRVTIFTPAPIYEDEMPVWEELLTGISFEVDEPSNSGSSRSTDEEDPTEEPSGTNSSDDEFPGVNGRDYESPLYPFTVSWDRSWEVIGSTSGDGVTTLTMSNGVSIINVWGGTFPSDPEECVSALAGIVENSDGVSNFRTVNNDAGEPQGGGDGTSAYGLFSLTQSGTEWFDYIRCQPSTDGEYVVAVVYQMPIAEFDTELTALDDFLTGIELN
jgi:hypothetical protein